MNISSAGTSSKSILTRVLAVAIAVLAVGAIGYVSWAEKAPPISSGVKVTLALPTQINNAPALIAFEQKLFEQTGVEVINQPFLLGKDALKSVLDGQADLAVVADTPVMLAVLDGKDIAILAGISQARRALAIVGRKDKGIASVADIKGKSVALVMGTNLPYFLDAMLHVNKIPGDTVNRIDLMKMPEVLAAFKEGRSDAAVVFQPFLAQLQAEMGERINVFYGEEVYAFRFLLVGKPAYIDSHPEEIRRILAALVKANNSIRADPVAARQTVGKVVKVDDAIMSRLFDPEDYVLGLDQAMLLALDDQTRWAMQQGLVKTGPVPNYLDFIKYQSLEAVLPAAVKIVR